MIATKRLTRMYSLRAFGTIWSGQLVSVIGSGLTGFAFGVWVYQRTGSVTQYTLVALFATLPGIVIAPLAGALADRWNRRWAMLLSDAGAALSTLSIIVLFWSGWPAVWYIYLAVAVSSVFGALRWPAYSAAVTQLVPKQYFGRATRLAGAGGCVARTAWAFWHRFD